MKKLGLLEPPSQMARSNGVDLLRGTFSLYVLLLGHIVFWTAFANGADAVPMWLSSLSRAMVWLFQSRAELHPAVLGFIVLSGYCIHRNGLRSRQHLRSFAIRRAYRILPVFWLASIAGIALFLESSQTSPEKAAALAGTTSLSATCFLAKVTTLAAIVPIAHPCDYLGNAPLLTVMVEIGLYAFYGIVFIRGGERLVLAACAISLFTGLIIASLNLKFPVLYNWWQNSSLLSFLPYWWIGAAAVCRPIRQSIVKYAPHIAAAWLLLTVATNYVDHTAISGELRKTCLAFLMAWLIVKIDSTAMKDNPISFIGRAGYSVYAFHAPVAIWLCVLGSSWWLNAVLVVAFGVSAHYLFERPLDRVGHSFAASSKPRPQAVLELPDSQPQNT